jgi:hypothetical protein
MLQCLMNVFESFSKPFNKLNVYCILWLKGLLHFTTWKKSRGEYRKHEEGIVHSS